MAAFGVLMSVVRTLVVIEDDEELAAVLSDEVARSGSPSVSAPTGAEGVRLAREVAHPLVILDHGLPDLSAVEVAALLSEQPAVPFLVVTGGDDMALVDEMLAHGARDYLVKDSSLFHRLPIVLRRVIADLEREARLADAERALRESHELVHSFLDALPIGVFIVAGDGRPAFVNSASLAIYGGGPENSLDEILARSELRREDGSPYPYDELPLLRALRGEEAHADDLVLTFGGRTAPLEAWATPIRGADGGVRYAVSAFADVSARKEAEAEIRALNASLQRAVRSRTNELEHTAGALDATERRARALFEQGAQVMMLLAPNGTVLDVNRAFRDAVGGRQIVGRSILDLCAPPFPLGQLPAPEVLRDLLARCVGAGEAIQFDAVQQTENGTLLAHRRVHLQRMLDDHGDVELVFLFAVDVTSLERAREELQIAWRMAEAANRTKSEFLANMSHEIRTPMTAILGFAELLAGDDALTADQRDHARTIEQAGQGLLALLDDVLEMSSIEAGRTELRPAAFAPATLLQEIERSYRSRAFDARLGLDVAPDTTRAIVRSDPAILRKILVQLVSNAIKFTERGRVLLGATLDEAAGRADGIATLSLTVEDTGPGIPSEALERIFDAFEQAGASPRTIGGTGLGLTIARRLALHLGGAVEVDSTVGQGTRFTVSVPVVEVGDEEALGARPSHAPDLTPSAVEALKATLAALDPSLRAQLASALKVGDLARLRALLAQVRDEAAVTALSKLVDAFDYDTLASLLPG